MKDHYYSVNPTSAHNVRTVEISVQGVTGRFDTDAGVFSRDGLDTGTRVLMEALPDVSGRVLDLGCGWGPVGTVLKMRYPEAEIVMTDVNQRAVDLSRANLKRNGVEAEVLQGDGFENVQGEFDFVITNPPIRAGKQAIYGMFAEAQRRLKAGGSLFIVIRKQHGAPSALKFLKETFGNAEVVEKDLGFWVIEATKV